MNKKGIELSINFLVMIVIAVALFLFGIKFMYDISKSANELKDMTLDSIDEKVGNILCETYEKSCIGIDKKVIRKNDLDYFALKIINVNNIPSFTVAISPAGAFDKEKNPIDNNLIYLPHERTLEIPNNDERIMGIGIQVPKDAKAGTYLFNVRINEYDEVHQIMVKVT